MTDPPIAGEGDKLWQRLRRRKVVQWGLAYVAGAWGFLQGLEYVSESFHWPDHYRQIALLALVAGLPIVLVLAWYHGDRGEQRVRGPELAIITLLFLAGGGLFWWYGRTTDITQTGDTAAATSSTKDPSVDSDTRPSIAVLPFDNRSRLEDDAFFVDGIHDDILTQLSKVSALKVISRTSVEQFRDTKLPIKEIAAQLGVRSILEGGVQRAGDRVRIHVQLIDTDSDAHVWAESYDRELTAANIFAIQSDVASAISSALKTALTPAERERVETIPTTSLEAWQAYQLGKQRMGTRNSAALIEAERYFRKAIARDPEFALAWVGLSDTLALQTVYGGRAGDAALGDAERAANRALELDPDLAEGWASMGLIATYRPDPDRAEQMLRRAIALNPNYAPAYQRLSFTLTELGRRNEALVAAEDAVMLDPLSAVANRNLGNTRAAVGRYQDALAAFEQAVEVDPTIATTYLSIGDVFAYGLARFDTAIPWYEEAARIDPGSPHILAGLAQAYWELSDDDEAGRWLDRILTAPQGTSYSNYIAALLFLDRGDDASALTYSLKAAESDPWYVFLLRDDDLRKGDYATARARYEKVYPELFTKELPSLADRSALAAIELALVLQHTGESERAKTLLDRSEAYFRTLPRMGPSGYWFSDIAIYALRGDRTTAFAKLREAEQAGCRGLWRYHRDFDPHLASIRNDPEFKAIFADIERDMARQRAALAARPKDAPLELKATGT